MYIVYCTFYRIDYTIVSYDLMLYCIMIYVILQFVIMLYCIHVMYQWAASGCGCTYTDLILSGLALVGPVGLRRIPICWISVYFGVTKWQRLLVGCCHPKPPPSPHTPQIMRGSAPQTPRNNSVCSISQSIRSIFLRNADWNQAWVRLQENSSKFYWNLHEFNGILLDLTGIYGILLEFYWIFHAWVLLPLHFVDVANNWLHWLEID